MFIPLDRKPEWRNPPLITLLLVIINVLCFTLWQSDDDVLLQQASEYYLDSDLPSIEFPLYRKYLETRPVTHFLLDDENESQLMSKMLFDAEFQHALNNGEIVTTSHPQYETWRQQHRIFQAKLNRVVIYRYSFKTAEPSILTLFTSMFLHGGWDHLIGNMIFLFLIGFSVEMTLGRTTYLSAYLISGVCSGLFYMLLMPNSLKWGIGASGAIAGLMGMYTILFGMRKIRFFFTLLFYFDFVRAPAIILLPIWLGYEVFMQIYSADNVNRFAHIGGLLSGALIGYLAKRMGKIDLEYLDREEKEQAFKLRYQEGLDHIARMELDKARRLFNELFEECPDRTEITEQLFNIAKLTGDEAIHDYALRLINLEGPRALPIRQLHDIFIDYVERVQPNVRLTPDQLISLALRFATSGFLEDAEKIVLYLTTRKSDFSRNAEGLMALATHYRRANNRNKAEKYLKMLLECYPNSLEAGHARQALG